MYKKTKKFYFFITGIIIKYNNNKKSITITNKLVI